MLARLLEELSRQETDGRFTFSIVVVDNDASESARPVVDRFATLSDVSTLYCVEARQNIALARNKAVENSSGDFVAFIDDDELPPKRWLLTLFAACKEYKVEGVLGPVKPHFDDKPPEWLLKGKFHDRPSHPTGSVIDWTQGRTGNVLLCRRILAEEAQPFRPEFRTGEDQDFFRRMIEKGYRFIWCHEAVAYEVVPPERWTRSFLVRKAWFQGQFSAALHATPDPADIAKSTAAVLAYGVLLPFALFAGHHRFMMLLIRLCHHAGKLFALVGVKPVKKAYVTN